MGPSAGSRMHALARELAAARLELASRRCDARHTMDAVAARVGASLAFDAPGTAIVVDRRNADQPRTGRERRGRRAGLCLVGV